MVGGKAGETERLGAGEDRRQGDVKLLDRERHAVGAASCATDGWKSVHLLPTQRSFCGAIDPPLPAERGDQFLRRSQRDRLALVDDGDAIAETLRLVHV